jgi:cell fate regulator YaaT (PSP1 superfamily)
MKIVDAEHILGGERVIFYFMSEGRVDFRDLVKTLSHEFQTRIEMRQIGARDEARLLGDVESCGQVVCCKQFLKYLKPVNMRMAKMQKATLDPAKISGYCGRLKCCLRYEDSTYGELKKKLPRKNTRVQLEDCEGRVIDGQILTQLILVETARARKGDKEISVTRFRTAKR